MNFLTKSYLAYSHGEKNVSPWVILKPLGWLGSVIVRTRRAFYDHGIYASEEPPLPVISVGNLTTGGTNKTPFVEFIAEQLSRWGLKPGIVSRGYGGTTSTPVVVLNGHGDRSVVGDEPLLLSSRLTDIPVAVSSDRMADVAALLNHNIDIVVADDHGGGIFATLEHGRATSPEAYDRWFGLAQSVDYEALAAAYGVAFARAGEPRELEDLLDRSVRGPRLIHAPVERAEDLYRAIRDVLS